MITRDKLNQLRKSERKNARRLAAWLEVMRKREDPRKAAGKNTEKERPP